MTIPRIIQDLPLRKKLLYALVAACLSALALACAALFWFQSMNFRKAFSAELESLGAIIAHNSAAPLTFDDRESAAEVLHSLKVNSYITSATVYDDGGRLFATMGGTGSVHAGPHAAQAPGVNFNRGHATLSLPIRLDENRTGHVDIEAYFADQYRDLLVLYALVLGAVLAGSLGVIALMSSLLQRIITGPIVALAAVARNITEKKDYSTRAVEQGDDEVGLLTRTFNRMLEQIQSRDERLQKSQERYEVAVLGSSDGLWDWDLATDAVDLSPRWKTMLGYADNELANSFESFRDILHPADRARVLAEVQHYLECTESTFNVEFRALTKQGTECWILSRGVALRDAQGKPFRFAGSHTDITARKRAEQEIRLARERFESLVNTIDGIVWEADPATARLLFVSTRIETMLGYPTQQWLDDPLLWETSILPEDRKATLENRQAGVAAGKPFQLDFRMTAANGRIVWLRDSITLIYEDDGSLRIRGLTLDTTARTLAAQELARMQRELVDSSRLAGMAEIATGVLHNVGNVLNNVNISCGLVQEYLRKSKTPSLAMGVKLLREHEANAGDYLSRDPKGKQLPAFFAAVSDHLTWEHSMLSTEAKGLQQNIEHIKQIVAMQQAYATVSGALEIVDVHELVEDALRMASIALKRHGIEVVRSFETVPRVAVDRHKVLQILINLLSNAKQAMAERTESRQLVLTIKVGEGDRIRIGIADNGVGIPRENITRIFNHGFTTKKNGHGFGLHSGANAAREMGGAVSVHSDGLGHGACFTLELPVRKDALPPTSSAHELEPIVHRVAA